MSTFILHALPAGEADAALGTASMSLTGSLVMGPSRSRRPSRLGQLDVRHSAPDSLTVGRDVRQPAG